MGKLVIKAEHYIAENTTGCSIDHPSDIQIQIFDDDNLVAETNLENLVQRFLLISQQNFEMATILDNIMKGNQDNIVIAGENELKGLDNDNQKR